MKYSDLERRIKIRIQYMIDSINILERYIDGVDFKEFESNQMLIDAVVKRIENIGEHANKIYDKPQTHIVVDLYPKIDWKSLASVRHLMVHEFEDLDEQEVFNTYDFEIKDIKRELEIILEDIRKGIFFVKFKDLKES